MTLYSFYRDAKQAIRDQFLGKRVRVTDAATSYPEDLEWATGRVSEIVFGRFGVEGEGQAVFILTDVEDAGYTDHDPRTVFGLAPVKVEGEQVRLMINNNYTQIDVLK